MDTSDSKSGSFQQGLYRPVEIVAWLSLAVCMVVLWRLPVPMSQERVSSIILFLIAFALYQTFVFRWLAPRYGSHPATNYIAPLGNIILLGWLSFLFGYQGLNLSVVYLIVVVITAVMAGRPAALFAALASAAAEAVVMLLQAEPSLSTLIRLALNLLAFVVAGWLVSRQTDVVRRQASEVSERPRELGFLLEASNAVSSLELQATLPCLAAHIARELPATFCRICLVDHRRSRLVSAALYPLRPLSGAQLADAESWLLADTPLIQRILETGALTIIRRGDATLKPSDAERSILSLDSMNSVCLIPLTVQGEALAIIVVGERRSWLRRPFSPAHKNLLQTMARQVEVVIQNARLHQDAQRQSERLAALLEVGRAVGSTIEMDNLLEHIHQQLDLIIPSDTYFVAFYNSARQTLDLRILIDDGQRFPPREVPLGQGLASWVIQTRRPLLVSHLTKEWDSLPIRPVVLGQDRMSESWVGVPILLGDQVLGILAVADYEPYAFDEDDIALLCNFAQQAALAMDNARHHAQVEEQARRDSLTGLFNHGYLLKRLHDAFEICSSSKTPLSLIMLDIDHFKIYNDQYGHLIGDEVLRLVAQAIQAHLTEDDLVGRWGGEEFTIVLPGCRGERARSVAEQMRQILARLPLGDSSGQPLPKPTISHGIATYPDHAANANELIVLADRALYQAKAAGRDQVRVASPTP